MTSAVFTGKFYSQQQKMETSPSVQDVVLNKDESMIVDSNATLKLGLRWDFFGGMAQDLDASAVFFDAFGHLTDAVYFNNLTSSDLSVVHSGDSKDGLGTLGNIILIAKRRTTMNALHSN